jgi:cell division protein FtsB
MLPRRASGGQGPTRPGQRSAGAARRPARSTFSNSASPRGSTANGRATAARQPARRTRPPRAPRPISGRAAALGLLLLALILAYAYPVRVYLAQQAQINQLRASQAAQRNRISDLQTQIARWNDPNYIITQARVRLGLVRKGELLFVVQADPQPSGASTTRTDRSWVSQLWSNMQGADHPDDQ